MCVGLSLPQEQIERTKGLPLHIGFYLCIYLVLSMYLFGYIYVSIWLYVWTDQVLTMEPAGGRSSSPRPREDAGRGWEGVWVFESWKEAWFLLREEVLLPAPRSFWYSMGDCRAENMRYESGGWRSLLPIPEGASILCQVRQGFVAFYMGTYKINHNFIQNIK